MTASRIYSIAPHDGSLKDIDFITISTAVVERLVSSVGRVSDFYSVGQGYQALLSG